MSVLRAGVLVGALTLAPACAAEEADWDAQPALGECMKAFCGNTPEFHGHQIWELDETGRQYSPVNQFRIRSAWSGLTKVALQVDGFAMWGLRPNKSKAPITRLIVESRTGDVYDATVNPGPDMNYYEGGDDGTDIPTYSITYIATYNNNTYPVQDLCKPKDGQPEHAPIEALVFQGDRYNGETAEVIATGAGALPWFNIACRDDALWKLALMRLVEAAQAPGFESDPDVRQAGVKSIIADYCGSGDPYTVHDAHVDWLNDWLTIDDESADFLEEAVWGPGGAVCMDRMRVPELGPVDCDHDIPTCWELLQTVEHWTELGSMETWAPDPL